MNFPNITAFYTALLSLGYLALSIRIIRLRYRHRVDLGDGNEPILQRAMRTHSNFIEYVPLLLIGLYCLETSPIGTANPLLVWILGGLLVLSRGLHFIGFGLKRGVSKGRTLGTALVFGLLIIQSLLLLWQCLQGMLTTV